MCQTRLSPAQTESAPGTFSPSDQHCGRTPHRDYAKRHTAMRRTLQRQPGPSHRRSNTLTLRSHVRHVGTGLAAYRIVTRGHHEAQERWTPKVMQVRSTQPSSSSGQPRMRTSRDLHTMFTFTPCTSPSQAKQLKPATNLFTCAPHEPPAEMPVPHAQHCLSSRMAQQPAQLRRPSCACIPERTHRPLFSTALSSCSTPECDVSLPCLRGSMRCLYAISGHRPS